MQFNHRTLDFTENTIYIMGILNVTPDSFSDGGKFLNTDAALYQVEKMIQEGAHIIDIGGESTRPFSDPVGLNEELDRVIPVIEKINERFETIISIDTYKSKVAEAAVKSGAEIINDISGCTFDPAMIDVAAAHQAKVIIMHIKGTPQNMQQNPAYRDMIHEIRGFLSGMAGTLHRAGVHDIIIDVGFGFGKSLEDNYILLKHLDKFKALGCPILAGISRKSMIGKVVDVSPEERLPGTIALNTLAIMNGARIIRVHDVPEHYQAVKVLEKYLQTDG